MRSVHIEPCGPATPPRSGAELITASISTDGARTTVWNASATLPSARTKTICVRRSAAPIDDSYATHDYQDTYLDIPVTASNVQVAQAVVGEADLLTCITYEDDGNPYRTSGRLLSTSSHSGTDFVLGPGVSHVNISATGDLFLGYSDIGVFEGSEYPATGLLGIGADGLVRLGPQMTPEWAMPSADLGWRGVSEVEAMTWGMPEEMWAYVEPDMAIVRVGHEVRRWLPDRRATPPTGVRQLAVLGDTVALVGDWRDSDAKVRLVQLRGEEWRPWSSVSIRMPDGKKLPEDVIGAAFHDQLYFLTKGEWHRAKLADIIAVSAERPPATKHRELG